MIWNTRRGRRGLSNAHNTDRQGQGWLQMLLSFIFISWLSFQIVRNSDNGSNKWNPTVSCQVHSVLPVLASGNPSKPALYTSGQFCCWVIQSLSSLGSRGVNPPIHLAVQRKKSTESNSSGCTQNFEPGDFCLGWARGPKPMSFSRSAGDLGLKTSLNPTCPPPQRKGGVMKERKKKEERDLYAPIPRPSLGCCPPSSLLWFVEHPWLLPTLGFPICCCPAWNLPSVPSTEQVKRVIPSREPFLIPTWPQTRDPSTFPL